MRLHYCLAMARDLTATQISATLWIVCAILSVYRVKMPHKRAKRSIRLEETAKRGVNLPPQTHNASSSYSASDTPRGGARILQSQQVRQKFRQQRESGDGRKNSEDTGERRSKTAGAKQTQGKKPGLPKIMPTESLAEFNRRLEAHMRPAVTAAIKDAANIKAGQERAAWQEKKERKQAAKEAKAAKDAKETGETTVKEGKKRAREEDAEEQVAEKPERPERPIKEFAPAPGPRRLNDVALAPPVLPGLRRSTATTSRPGEGVFKPTGRTPLSAGQRRLLEEERERVVARYREMKEIKLRQREADAAAEAAAAKPKGKGKASSSKRPRDD